MKLRVTYKNWVLSYLYHSVYIYIYIYIIYIHIYTNDLFYITTLANVCNSADDTFHACNSDLGNPINWLGHDSMLVIEWSESILY